MAPVAAAEMMVGDILLVLFVPLLIVLGWCFRISLMLAWMQIVEMWRHWWAKHGK